MHNDFKMMLSPEELELLVELLEAERHRLLLEIRHADRRMFKDQLTQRFDLVDRLSTKVEGEILAP